MRIRNLGNHEHNNLVIRSGAGELVVVSRPTGDTDHQPQDYTPCPHVMAGTHVQIYGNMSQSATYGTSQEMNICFQLQSMEN